MGFDEKRRLLVPVLVLSQLLGLAAVACIIAYISVFQGSIKPDNGTLTTDILIMLISLLYLNGTAMMLYRAFPSGNKKMLKVAHAAIQFAVMCTVIGALIYTTCTGFGEFWADDEVFSTLFSWMSIISLVVFILQWVVGFVMFVLPTGQSMRASYMPIHRYFGGVMLFIAVVTIDFAITERAFNTEYYYSAGYDLLDFTGLFTNLFGFLVSVVLLTDAYKRPDDAVSQYEDLDRDTFKLPPVRNDEYGNLD